MIALIEKSQKVGRTIGTISSLLLMNALECQPVLSKVAIFN